MLVFIAFRRPAQGTAFIQLLVFFVGDGQEGIWNYEGTTTLRICSLVRNSLCIFFPKKIWLMGLTRVKPIKLHKLSWKLYFRHFPILIWTAEKEGAAIVIISKSRINQVTVRCFLKGKSRFGESLSRWSTHQDKDKYSIQNVIDCFLVWAIN